LTTKEPKIIAGREFPNFGAGHSTQPMPTGPQSQGLAKMAAKESCGIATSGGVRVMHGGRQILDPSSPGTSRQQFNRFAFSVMTTFKIQTLANGEWNDSAAKLGFGCPQDDNLWATKKGGLAACDELAADGNDAIKRITDGSTIDLDKSENAIKRATDSFLAFGRTCSKFLASISPLLLKAMQEQWEFEQGPTIGRKRRARRARGRRRGNA